MTRSGEKLYGDWEKRFGPNPPPFRRWIVLACLVVAIALFAASMPGF